MIKVVLDTNVIVSGFNFPKSNPGRILTMVASGEITNFVSKPILEETKRILADSFSRWLVYHRRSCEAGQNRGEPGVRAVDL